MGFFSGVKKAVTVIAVAVDGCAECGPNPGGNPGRCHCDFLDDRAPTTAELAQQGKA